MMRRGIHLQNLRPSREESLQARPLSKGQVQRDHSLEDLRNRVRALLDRGQSQGKGHLARDPGKVQDHQARDLLGRDPDQARVPLAKEPLGRAPGQARDHQAKDPQGSRVPNQVKDHLVKPPNRVALPSKKVDPHSKDLGNLDPNSKGHQTLELILEVLLLSRELENLQGASARYVRPPS